MKIVLVSSNAGTDMGGEAIKAHQYFGYLLRHGFDAVLVVGTTASFGYILEPVWRVRQAGGSLVEVNLQATEISPLADVLLQGRAADVLSQLVRHISSD